MALPLKQEFGPDYTMTIWVLLVLVLGSPAAAEKPFSDPGATLRVLELQVLRRRDVADGRRQDNLESSSKSEEKLRKLEERVTRMEKIGKKPQEMEVLKEVKRRQERSQATVKLDTLLEENKELKKRLQRANGQISGCDMARAVSRPGPDNLATTGKGSQNVQFVEEKKTKLNARKQHNLFEILMREKVAAAIIEQAVIQALMGGGTQANTNKGNKTRKSGFRPRWSSKHRVYV